MDLKQSIRTIPDYPKPGIMFRDITTLLSNPEAFSQATDKFTHRYKDMKIDFVAGIESRGFIFGAALALKLNKGFIPIRKKGKLPGETFSVSYELEYGSDELEIHKNSFPANSKILLIDDLLATGGTAIAASQLIEKAGGYVIEAAFVVDLPDLGGKNKLEKNHIKCFTLVEFEGD